MTLQSPLVSLNFRSLLAAILPGLFLLGFNIGTGSVTAMAKAGAEYGMSLLWTVLISCVITWRLIALYGRFTIVTGRTALSAFREYIHPAVAWFFIIALTVSVSGSVMGVMGVMVAVAADAFERMLGLRLSTLLLALLFIILVYGLFWRGRTISFERVLAVLVALMGACFVANLAMAPPSLGSVLAGLVPSVPAGGDGVGVASHLVIASMVGTTVFSGLFIIRTTLVKEAGWTLADYRRQEMDAGVSAALMFLLSAAIMAAAAGALHSRGEVLHDPAQMAALLEPVAGTAAAVIFAIGVVAAGLSSQFPNVILLPWLLCDHREQPRDMRRPRFRVIVLLISLLGLVVPVFGARPLVVMIASQAFSAILLPVTVGCILYLGNRRDVMGAHRFGRVNNAFLAAVFGFACFTAWLGFSGVWRLLESVLAAA